jgi:hypothetical protein
MKVVSMLLAVLFVTAFTATSYAYTFTPSDADLQDLPHDKYFIWGINWAVPQDEAVTAASVVFHDIYNWAVEPNDRLWLHLLQQAPAGITSGYDNEAAGTWFAPPRYTREQILLNEFKNLPEGYNHRADVTYDFDAFELAALNSYALAGNNFGLGFDPDCHYYNNKIELKVTTGMVRPPVPEPGTFALVGLGLVGVLGGVGRKRITRS